MPDAGPDRMDQGNFTWKAHAITTGYRYVYIDQSLGLNDRPARRGYRTIAPDLLGYGGSSKPTDIKAYSKLSSCKALVEILDHENISQKIIVVGHDWGSALAARFVQYFPERVKAWATLCVQPYRAAQRGESPPDFETLVRSGLPHLGYQLYFTSPESSAEIHQYRKTLLLLLYLHTDRGLDQSILDRFGSLKRECFTGENVLKRQIKQSSNELERIEVKDPEIRHFLSEFEKGGMLGPLNWYKTRPIDHADEQAAALSACFPSEIPCLYVGAAKDPAFPPERFTEKSQAKLFPAGNLTCNIIQGGNHFMHQDPCHRREVSKVLGDWIDSLPRKSFKPLSSHL